MTNKERFLSTLDPDWELVGEYVNAKTMTEFRHKPCGAIVRKTPMVLKNKPKSCRVCNANRLRMSNADFLDRVKFKTDRYEFLTEYKGWNMRIKVRHKVCGKTFWQFPRVCMESQEGCPYCVGETISKARAWNDDDFRAAMGERADEYELLSKYVDSHTPVKMRHKCGNVFEVTPDSFLRGSGCKSCKYSTGEGEVYRAVCSFYEGAIQGNRSILPYGRELDIIFPKERIAIEYDGVYYHSVENLRKSHPKFTRRQAETYHLWKTNEAYKKGYRVLHIYEDEWLDKQDIVLDRIKNILHLPCEKYYARNTVVEVVDSRKARAFLNVNHIQGQCRAGLYLGLYEKSSQKLVAVMGFARLRRGLGGENGDEWELQRYATLLGTTVIGGFSKCLAHFIRQCSPSKIISYGNLRWIDRDNNVYLANGFTPTKTSLPSYYYVKGLERFHRFNFRKERIKKMFPDIYSDEKTEREMMFEAGYRRIYDCGTIRYELVL